MADNNISVAYIVLAHSDPSLFGRLTRRLRDKRVAFFVHLDVKTPIEAFEAEADSREDIYFTRPRFRVMWAGISQVSSTLATMQNALEHTTANCTHFVIISGADYPIATNDEIVAYLASNKQRQFIRRFSLIECGDRRQLWRVRGIHFREWADRFTWQRKPLFALEQMLHAFPRRINKNLTLALGSNWVALTRECAEYCVGKSREAPELFNFLKMSFGPDEIYLHTLVENSPFVDQAQDIEPYHDITKIGGPFYYANLHALVPKVPIRTADEAREILANRGDKLFTRKLSSFRSQAALDVFDQYIDRRVDS
ncbi:beta-1,6-N-acetylglucosaminyltransferase [Methylobacterium sp. WL18]|uniref:beta-1,6-N-acetylglucosaminyltransferase n=1 Tax=Methylobacterium sp. WL18 TaxID=2603897 RepID=UPI001650D146|nr:beta-1,6-N-acetylglucosaminyltransferase [Methylobacterium sp. WL18]